MKKLKDSFAAKLIALVLICLAAMSFIFAGIISAMVYSYGGYNGVSSEEIEEQFLKNECVHMLYSSVIDQYRYGSDPESLDVRQDMSFSIYSPEGELIYDGLKGKTAKFSTDMHGFYYPSESIAQRWIDLGLVTEPLISAPAVTPRPSSGSEPAAEASPALSARPSAPPAPTPSSPPAEKADIPAIGYSASIDGTDTVIVVPDIGYEVYDYSQDKEESEKELGPWDVIMRYKIQGHVLEGAEVNSQDLELLLLNFGVEHRFALLAVMIGSVILALACFIFLMRAAGHKSGVEGISPGITERIPFDVFTLCLFFPLIFTFALGMDVSSSVSQIPAAISICVSSVCLLLLFLWWCMSLAVRLKMGKFLDSCLCWRLLRWCWKAMKDLFRILGDAFKSMALMPKATFIILIILLIEFLWLMAAAWSPGKLLLGWFIERIILVGLTFYVLFALKQLLQAGRKLAAGDLEHKVDVARMHGPLKEHGEQLNQISQGMTNAVNERMKSEHLRTELITNVSHDIKTPLTSIINYVDLLEKQDIQDEKAKEYLAVLSRQSARLKKLIEDLIQASKASSGALPVDMQPCQLDVLLDQCTGEFMDRLKAAGLELVVNKPEESISVMADGRHMWRVFDNLLNNICKYAMKGSRVYLSLEKDESCAKVIFRNISASQLNISGDELMERFVRGDSSRNTEGSGLGLSIAKSLMQLQKGSLDISIDGDLFKVTVSLPLS